MEYTSFQLYTYKSVIDIERERTDNTQLTFSGCLVRCFLRLYEVAFPLSYAPQHFRRHSTALKDPPYIS